ncbi:hypothetical protein ERD78_04355 [Allopusillimonas soli]|uniref:Rhodanese domain-containing protein n=1 Tax=Allopusillimonas soli TaxID=659016 RepID=A0A853F6A4_9BURK|nr:rhodanese-like domain-containing protein [Allopusillimonas soli]NYT36095.1 hypothetical protein [Allopusillimonas soli]TEA76431.1 hypothetical protein ERD78_04355 [Allopusillimonas soli]
MTSIISFPAFDRLRESDTEWALFDVRELAEANSGHILGACFLPRRMLELRIGELVPDTRTFVVLYDDGTSRRAELAADALHRVGYENVHVLEGGLVAWLSKGREVTSGSNVAGKIFGEYVHETLRVPQVSAETLKTWLDEGRDCIICDIRTPVEYADKRIPNARGAFGVDLVSVAHDLKEARLPIVVHCAGRTRGIIACQGLRELGLDNVYALENGTMGWQLAGFRLERGSPQGILSPTPESVQVGRQSAMALARSAGVTEIEPDELAGLIKERDARARNIYVYDVRQVDQYETAHIRGAQVLPGGLAMQRIDDYMPARRAILIFVDDDTGRAFLTAFWFRKLGWQDVRVLRGGLQVWKEAGYPIGSGRDRSTPLGLRQARENSVHVSADALQSMKPEPLIVHVDTSKSYETARVPGAIWIPYGWLEYHLGQYLTALDTPVILTCRTGVHSVYAAANLRRLGYSSVRVLEGGINTWKQKFTVDSGWPDGFVRTPDVVVPPYDSSLEEMARYLEWEQRLSEDLSADAFLSWST